VREVSAESSGEIYVPRIGDEVVYLERSAVGSPLTYKAQVADVHVRPHTPPVLDLACVDGRGRAFARTRVSHESTPGWPVAWKPKR
jgi:hypothetical protein